MGRLLIGGALLCVVLAFFSRMDADWMAFLYPPAGSFNGQVVWITGASSGIGAALARDLVKNGAQVIISARRINSLHEVAKSCEGKYKPYVVPLDVTDYAARQLALNDILSKFGRIDSVVLNAGKSQRATAIDTTFEDTKSLFDLNVFAVIHLTKLVLPIFLKQGSGQFVVVSSVSGFLGTPIGSSYSATKFALASPPSCFMFMILDLKLNYIIICSMDILRRCEPNMPMIISPLPWCAQVLSRVRLQSIRFAAPPTRFKMKGRRCPLNDAAHL